MNRTNHKPALRKRPKNKIYARSIDSAANTAQQNVRYYCAKYQQKHTAN